jgi:hypothetical protein
MRAGLADKFLTPDDVVGLRVPPDYVLSPEDQAQGYKINNGELVLAINTTEQATPQANNSWLIWAALAIVAIAVLRKK